MIMNKMQAEDNITKKTSQNKQKRLLTPQQTGLAAKPRDNSEMISENVKVSNSTVRLRYISSFPLFSQGHPTTIFGKCLFGTRFAI